MNAEHDMDLIDRCEAYLEGVLGPDATAAFERSLVRPEVAETFREALLLRELIRASTADEPPEGLEERIAARLGLDSEVVKEKLRTARFVRTRTALRDMSWMVRGPGLVMAPVQASGVNISVPRGKPSAPGAPLWRRALRFAWRKRT